MKLKIFNPILIFVVALMSTVVAPAQCEGDCENGWGKYTWQNGSSFTGYWESGDYKNGEADILFPNETQFKGTIENGQFWNGDAHIFYEEPGEYFKGVIFEGKNWNGQINISSNSGGYFNGVLKDGIHWSGNTKIIYTNGGNFEGTIYEGKEWNGESTAYLNSGAKCDIKLVAGEESTRVCNNDNVYKKKDLPNWDEKKSVTLIKKKNKVNAYFLNLSINNKPTEFLFDTGCSGINMNLTQWEKLDVPKNKYVDLNINGTLSVVGGSVQVKYYKLNELKLDGSVIKNVVISVSQTHDFKNMESDNLLGIGFFKKFSNVVWDLKDREITFLK
jgi:predicted aspartyl protease